MDLSCIAANIQALKHNLGVSLSVLAAECEDLSYSSMNNYVYGHVKPPLSAILKICNAFKVSPNILLAGLFEATSEIDSLRQIEELVVQSEKGKNMLEFFLGTSPTLKDADFGARIKILRAEAGYSVIHFAKMCSIARTSLAGIESNQRLPGLEVFLTICSQLKLSPEYLLAPCLGFSTFANPEMLSLTPRQISFFLNMIPALKEDV